MGSDVQEEDHVEEVERGDSDEVEDSLLDEDIHQRPS